MQNQTGWLFRGKQLDSENRKLAERVAQLEGENTLLKDQAVRYEQLRNDLGFVKQSPKALLAADIIARRIDSKYETLLVARGTNDGVKVDSAVVTRNGLVGRVFETTATTAAVLMITDQKSGAGGRVLRANSRAIGVCKGDNSNTLTLTYLENDADIVAGDEIVTSGLGGIYPPGIRIGVVREVKVDPTSAIKTAKVVPAVVFDKLEEVYIQK
jgi:rod shape-determining protein MreC